MKLLLENHSTFHRNKIIKEIQCLNLYCLKINEGFKDNPPGQILTVWAPGYQLQPISTCKVDALWENKKRCLMK